MALDRWRFARARTLIPTMQGKNMRQSAYALVMAVAVYAGSAAAHAVLMSSSPAANSVLAEAPREIRLSFNERIEARFSSVTLTRNDRTKVQVTRPAADPEKQNDLIVSLPALAPGKYQVRWQTTSADSHRIQGQFGFEIKP
jgi:copper resistance protein C